MSYKVANLCAERKFGSPVRKQIIMFLADKASDDGSGIWCSKGTVQRHTELGESTVKRTITDFLKQGILIETGRRSCKNGYTVIYRIVLSAISHLEPVAELDDERPSAWAVIVDGVPSEPGTGSEEDGVPGPLRTPNHPKTIQEPLPRVSAPEAAADSEFEEIWRYYPDDRRRGKALCQDSFRRAINAGAAVTEIADAVRAYAKESAGYTRSKVSFSDNWFRQERWKMHVEARRAQSEAAAETLEGQLEQLAAWIKGQNFVCRHITKKQARAVLARGLVSRAELENAGVQL
jgi:hypothetical protein